MDSEEVDRNALEHIINDIVVKSNQELKLQRQKLSLNSMKKTEQPDPPTDLQTTSTPKLTPYQVTETLAAFVLRSVALDKKNGFDVEMEFSGGEVDRLIKCCMDQILMVNCPMMETVKMQVYFDTHFSAQVDFLNKEKSSRNQTCQALLKDIIEVKIKSIPIYESLYRKICSYVLVRSHVGNPTDIRIIREGTAALESVFPQSELGTFIPLTRGEKEEQLNGLTQLVTGIRLFNKQLGKGGENIDNCIKEKKLIFFLVPELCANELQDLSTIVGQMTTESEEDIQLLIAVIDFTTKFPQDGESEKVDIKKVKSALVFRRQLLMYLDALQDQMIRTRATLLSVSKKFDLSVQELKNTCKAKTAVAVDQPHFIILSNLWLNWLDELFLLSFRRGLFEVLVFHSKSYEIVFTKEMKKLSIQFYKEIEPENAPDQNIIQAATEIAISLASINKGIDMYHPGNTSGYFSLPVQFGGFCPVTLIFRDGLVVPGDKNIGLLHYKDSLFTFAGMKEAREFAKSPEKFIAGVVDMAKENPDLVQLLHLYQYFPTVDALENARSYTRQKLLGKLPMVSEVGTQVDTHIVDGFIDPKYQWNEWELRRTALMLVNLKNKRTHFVQTDLSHFKRDSETQHYGPKSQISQTTIDSGTKIPKRVNFHAGLRNDGKNVKYRVVDLTLNL